MNAPTISERFTAVDRVLRAARGEATRGCHANAALFLRAAARDLDQITATLESTAEVVPMLRRDQRP